MRPGATAPDQVVYGVFLRHVGTFENLAEANEARGESGAAYRNHLAHKFGLTITEQTKVNEIAQTYVTQYKALNQQLEAAAKDYRALNFPNNEHIAGAPAPAKSPALIAIQEQIRQTTLQARDQVHAALGDTRFAQVDAQVRARATHDLSKIAVTGN